MSAASGDAVNIRGVSSMPKFPIALFFLTILLGVAVAGNVAVSQDYGLRSTADEAGITKKGGRATELTAVVGKVVGTILWMTGVLFFGLMVYGGVLWMIDRGNEDKSKRALETIKAAVIGMIIILASYAITSFVFGSVKKPGGPSAEPASHSTSTP